MKKYLFLFLTMLKIGLFTFGGGYAMLALLEQEFVSAKKWLTHEEFLDMVAISESTPGPIAINAATYLGYKMGKLKGALVCTVGVCLPSLLILYVISLFFNEFLTISWVASAFRGIQVCVVVLILSAGVKMFCKLEKNLFSICVFLATYSCMVLFSVFAVNFSSIFYLLLSAAAGVTVYAIGRMKGRREK